MYPLYIEITKLRKKLEMPCREFEDGELTDTNAICDRTDEKDKLLGLLRIKIQLGPIMYQIQKYRKQLEVSERKFDEEELNNPDAVEDLTTERNNLKLIIPLADQIHRITKN
eukprot:TRINITY_DN7833_c0_g1_i1.p1 TRINITY_DN7833_c0_g1~~TRINITY_DN7833_c0_g1_i1.p1  ORF type:complete len:112 (-),score=14.23 TRINITY_DN7833_c0_g1_i1:183-518(-)